MTPRPPAAIVTASTRPARGFSLPEVALAMGIAATALLTLISLLPFGLDTLRDSSNKQAEARILQTVMDRYQTGVWLDESATGGSRSVQMQDCTLFFDQTGAEVASATGVDCNYAVQVKVGTEPSLQGDNEANPYLRQLRVRVTDRLSNYTQSLADGSGKYRERSVWIALLEQTGPLTGAAAVSSL
ncbi:Verru_Chthon cassette protein B [Verrucomicrobium spinosum]|uniref:Verru_Chthon cassette protein B n=1 Tax=Verrucomicrobium spinosum TaxID=2736 RepID=UPI0001746862|nr:Verru_Chthon cassette protein B [Verrucomicrobium spinosum]